MINIVKLILRITQESKGKQGKERDEALRLPGIIKGKGKMMSRIHDVIIPEAPGKASLDKLFAKPCKTFPISFTGI